MATNKKANPVRKPLITQKATPEQIADATAPQMVTAFTTHHVNAELKTCNGSYEPFKGQGEQYGVLSGAFTNACLITSALVTMKDTGLLERSDAIPQFGLLQLMTPAAYKKFCKGAPNHGVLIDRNGMTDEGMLFINNRMQSGGPAFNTSVEVVNAMLVAIGTGHNLKLKGCKGIKMAEVSAMRAVK